MGMSCVGGSCSRGGGLALAALVAAALPVARALAQTPVPAVDPDGTLQAFADTILPGRRVDADRDRRADPPAGDRGRRPRARRGRDRRARALPPPEDRLRRARARVPRRPDRAAPAGGRSSTLDFDERTAVVHGGPGVRQPRRALRLGGRGGRAVHRVLRRRAVRRADRREGRRLPRHGPAGRSRDGYTPSARRTGAAWPASARRRGICPDGRARRRPHRRVRASAARSPRSASPSSTRAAGADPTLDRRARARPRATTRFKQSMHIDHLSRHLHCSSRATARRSSSATASAAARTSTSPRRCARRRETFERRDRRPGDGPERRMWPARDLAPRRSTRTTRAPRRRCASRGRRGSRSRSRAGCGRRRSTPPATRATACRWRSTSTRCRDVKWCHTGCVFGAKNSVTPNYLAARRARAACRCARATRSSRIRQSSARPYRYVVTRCRRGRRAAAPVELECKVLVLAAGAMGNAPMLMRSRPTLPVAVGPGRPPPRRQRRPHRRDRVRPEARSASVLGLPGYARLPRRQADHDDDLRLLGRPARATASTARASRSRRSSSRSLTNFLYDDGRAPGGDPSWWGLQKKQAIGRWANRIELLAMVEDTHDGSVLRRAAAAAAPMRPNAGPVAVGHVHLQALRAVVPRPRGGRPGDAADRRARAASAKFMKLTETQGGYASHPLGGCRMAASPDLGVVDHRGAVFGYEGLYCIDSSIVPTSLGVNPSLTIAARVASAAPSTLVRGAGDLGLPPAPGSRSTPRDPTDPSRRRSRSSSRSLAAPRVRRRAPPAGTATNPFACTLQQAGFEATAPTATRRPTRTASSSTSAARTSPSSASSTSCRKEPARVAAAADKCFYFQSDHWRGSIVQDDGSTKTYEWDGHYFFDKARGEGGAWVDELQRQRPHRGPEQGPGHPAGVRAAHGPGHRRRARRRRSVEADPRCAERAQREPEKIYADAARRAAGPPRGSPPRRTRCRAPAAAGHVARARPGPPRRHRGRVRERARRARPRSAAASCATAPAAASSSASAATAAATSAATTPSATVMLVATRGSVPLRAAGTARRARAASPARRRRRASARRACRSCGRGGARRRAPRARAVPRRRRPRASSARAAASRPTCAERSPAERAPPPRARIPGAAVSP